MIHRLKRLSCIVLCMVLMLQLAQPALAYRRSGDGADAASPEEIVLTDAEGNEVRNDEEWTETYPYGAFAFDVTAADVNEGDDTVVTVYRVGGTAGRATAYIAYSPLLVPNEDGSAYYGYALSGKDLSIEAENPQPIAQYQPVGKPADPEPGTATVEKSTNEQGYVLTLSQAADSYQWEIFYDGSWCAVRDSDQQSMELDAEYMSDGMDYRCIYTVNGVRYCTDSLKGEEYVKPEPEALEPMPEDIELNPEPTYTAIAIDDESDPYSGWIFGLTFAEGEWAKEIHFHAYTDELAEAMEAATLRIAYTDGGEIYSGADTLLYHVADMNESTPSTVGFTLEKVDADKADGTVNVMVKREGGFERPVTVEYRTVDGQAKAGTDYVAASGTLMFYGNVTELPVNIELIDTQVQSGEALDFSIELSELKGDDNCKMTADTATVTLINSGEGDASNLASRLYDSEAVDVSAAVKDSPTSANSGSEPAVGEQVELAEPQWIEAELLPAEEAEMSTQVHHFEANNKDRKIDFGTTSTSSDKSWKSTVQLADAGNFTTITGNTDKVKKYGASDTISDVGNKVTGLESSHLNDSCRFSTYPESGTLGGVAFAGTSDGSLELDRKIENNIGQMYSGYKANVTSIYAHDATYLDGTTYKRSWTEPKLLIGKDLELYGKVYQTNDASFLNEPRDTHVASYGTSKVAGATNWNVNGKSSFESGGSYDNPYSHEYTGEFKIGDTGYTGRVYVTLDMPYYQSGWHYTDDLYHKSVIHLKSLEMTRRTFKQDAFYVDVSTPNDDNTAPAGCMKLSSHDKYLPKISILDEYGGAVSNKVYVGSQIQIKAHQDLPAGLSIVGVEVLTSTDNGANWTKFEKFHPVDKGNNTWVVTLLGTHDDDHSDELTIDEINKNIYKFRVVYARENTVKVDLTPSLPRDNEGNTQTDQVAQLFNNYTEVKPNTDTPKEGAKAQQKHCFGGAKIKYGYSTYNSDRTVMDYSNKIADSDTITPVWTEVTNDNGSMKWSRKVTNLQCINFGLPAEDLLLLNGTPYRGNDTIYFTEAELAGDIIIKYYHENYQSYINAMTPDIAWMGLYLDGDGDGKIAGEYNPQDGSFELDENSEDQFIRYLRTGESFNELEIAPEELETDTSEHSGQYFIQACYSMTPRCLTIPADGNESDRAQVLAAITTAIDPASPDYKSQSAEQRKYNYVVSAKDGLKGQDGNYTSDDHAMYKYEASVKTVLSFPLGGDKTPA
ncbi:MAG: hypothetical protein IJG63_05170 [Oscillospiraceae bacterium]|nr:hypothetical protein [Oscillospiraceae bacterium]